MLYFIISSSALFRPTGAQSLPCPKLIYLVPYHFPLLGMTVIVYLERSIWYVLTSTHTCRSLLVRHVMHAILLSKMPYKLLSCQTSPSPLQLHALIYNVQVHSN